MKFSPQSFEKPFEYLSMTETEQTVKAFKDYIRNGVHNPEPIFKHGIREMVVPGFKAEEIWDGENSLAKDYVTYFTYATPNGIIFVKPGVVIDKTYDPSKRSWYEIECFLFVAFVYLCSFICLLFFLCLFVESFFLPSRSFILSLFLCFLFVRFFLC